MNRLRRALKYIGITIGGLLTLVVCLYLIVVVVNWNDRPQSALVIETLKEIENRPVIADRDNANIYFLGFSSPLEIDPFQFGADRNKWIKEALALDDFEHSEYPYIDSDYNFGISSEVSKILKACGIVHSNCLQTLNENQHLIVSFQKEEIELFDRYIKLIKLGEFQELMPDHLNMNFPIYNEVFNGQGVYHLNIWDHADAGEIEFARDMLELDIKFWRMVLSHSDTLITKMIAISGITRNFQFGNLILRQLDHGDIERAIPPSWAAPFTREERSLKRSLAGDWTGTDRLIKKIKSDNMPHSHGNSEDDSIWEETSQMISKPLFQAQDTSNLILESLMQFVDIYDVEYEKIPNSVVRGERLSDLCTDPLYSIYNPVGHIWANVGCYAHLDYFLRANDIEGVRLATLTVSDLRSKNILKDDVRNWLSIHDIREPYWNNSFSWDDETGAVIFHGLERGDRGRHSLLY